MFFFLSLKMRLEYGQFVTIGNNNRCMKTIFRKRVKIPKRVEGLDGINVAACPERKIDLKKNVNGEKYSFRSQRRD